MRREVRRTRVGCAFHRWYTPNTGRYSRTDPIREVYGLYSGDSLALLPGNPYLYVGSNPLYYIDPSGLTLQQAFCALKYSLVGALGGAVAGAGAGCAAGAGVGVFAGGVGAVPGCGGGTLAGGILGGITGAVGGAIVGTIQCQCESTDRPKPEEPDIDCKEAKQYCIDKCTDETLPTGTYSGDPFFYCYRQFIDSFGC